MLLNIHAVGLAGKCVSARWCSNSWRWTCCRIWTNPSTLSRAWLTRNPTTASCVRYVKKRNLLQLLYGVVWTDRSKGENSYCEVCKTLLQCLYGPVWTERPRGESFYCEVCKKNPCYSVCVALCELLDPKERNSYCELCKNPCCSVCAALCEQIDCEVCETPLAVLVWRYMNRRSMRRH